MYFKTTPIPKPSTFPTLYNQVHQLSISNLKEWEYLKHIKTAMGTIKWSSNGNETASISITVCTSKENPFAQLDYSYNKTHLNYKVKLVSIPSNLGKGRIWYFLCPKTNLRYRILYLINGYFYHRNAFKNGIYESQVFSKNLRLMDKTLGVYFGVEKLYTELYKKNFKRYYAGKPTKRYLKIMEQIKKADSISPQEIKSFF